MLFFSGFREIAEIHSSFTSPIEFHKLTEMAQYGYSIHSVKL